MGALTQIVLMARQTFGKPSKNRLTYAAVRPLPSAEGLFATRLIAYTARRPPASTPSFVTQRRRS
jgi:hypothetical protein